MKIPFPKNFNQKKPTLIHDSQEIAIILFGPLIQFNRITLEELQNKQVIPPNWQLIKPPQSPPQPQVKQFIFKEGFKIILMNEAIYFITQIKQNSIDLDKIVNNFIYNFPQININKSEINLRRLISLPGDEKTADKFIKQTILNKGEWQNFHDLPMKATVSFSYNFKGTPLVIKLTDITIRASRNKIKSALLFQGIFNNIFDQSSKTVKLQKLESVIKTYPKKIEIFNYIINKVFLGKS